MKPVRKLIRTDGTSMDLPAGKSMDELREIIGADTLDSVTLRHMGEPLCVMLVDDNGYRARKPVNAQATELYMANCRPGTTHQIVGDVIVVPDSYFGDD